MKTMSMIKIYVGDTLPNGTVVSEAWCRKIIHDLPMFTYYDPTKHVLLVSQTELAEVLAPLFDSLHVLADGISKVFTTLEDTIRPVLDEFVKVFDTPEGKAFLKACHEAQLYEDEEEPIK